MNQAPLTIPEAAYVAGLSIRTINHEIDERIIRPERKKGIRRVQGTDLLYLSAIKNVRKQMGQQFRKRVRDAIVEAWDAKREVARVEHFTLALPPIEQELIGAFETLQRLRAYVESRPDVLAGEPVVKGTRIAVRHVADLIKRGASLEELGHDLDITREQIEAAVVFDRVTPRVGRPPAGKMR